MMINGEAYGKLTPDGVRKILQEFAANEKGRCCTMKIRIGHGQPAALPPAAAKYGDKFEAVIKDSKKRHRTYKYQLYRYVFL